MGFHQGKKARAAYEAFNAKAMEDGKPAALVQLAYVLERRTLGDKHFAQAVEFLNGLQQAAKLTIHAEFTNNSEARLQERMVNLSLLHFALGRNTNGDVSNSRYIPLTTASTVRHDYVSYRTRPLPIIFASNHTEERFGYWLRQDLDYTDKAFMNTVMIALAMAKPLERLIETKYATEIPLSIPHEKGFFLGYVGLSNPTNFLFQPGFIARAKDENGKPDLRGFNDTMLLPEWMPSIAMTVRTFVPHKTFSDEQIALHKAFSEILEAHTARRALGLMLAGYTTGLSSQAREDRALIKGMETQLGNLIGSNLWERVQEKSIKHLPSEQMTHERGPS